MKAVEVITNLHTENVEHARGFFRFLGLTEVGMDRGWVARFNSPDSDACVQGVTSDATAPEDSIMTIVKAGGAEIIMELHDTDYGSRDFAIKDPEGNRWSFGTYRGEPRKP